MLRTKAPRLEMLLAVLLGAALVMGEWTIGLRPRQAEQNVQPFSGAIGGLQAPPITNSGDLDRPYEVEGDTFPDFASAASRSCDTQKNDCADAANNGGGFEISECEAQNAECMSAAEEASASETAIRALVSSDDQFDYFCDL